MTTTAPATFDEREREIELQLEYADEMISGETALVEWANEVEYLRNYVLGLRQSGGTAEQVQEATNRLRQVERQGPRPVPDCATHGPYHELPLLPLDGTDAEVERAAEHGANNSISN